MTERAADAAAPHRLAAERLDYLAGALTDDLPSDPLVLLRSWMDAALDRRAEHDDLPEPTAAVLSTVAVDEHGSPRPRSRTVLLKGCDARGVVVFTNLSSAKARELAATPTAALLLPWYPLQRQVRIEGAAAPVPAAESDAYWATRPRASQLGSWASQQSAPVASRAALEERYAETAERFSGVEVPRPDFWGGLRLRPERIEFWQGRAHRLHDRILFELSPTGGWRRTRLQP